MKLQELYTTPGYATPKGKDESITFEKALETANARAQILAPEDRTIKPAKFLFAGIGHFKDHFGREHKVDYLREAGSDRSYALTDNAFTQLAQRVGPSTAERVNFPGYLRVCDEKLRVLNLNSWLQKNGGHEVFMRSVRPYGVPFARGFLSDRYVEVDDLDLMGVLKEIPEAQGAAVRMMEFTESTMHLRLTWKNERRELKVGDAVEFGVHISNSEIGHRAVRVEPIVYRLKCSNGMISGGEGGDGSWYIRHAGKKDRVVGAMNEAIKSALPAAREMAIKFSKCVGEVIDRPVERLKGLAKDENLTEVQLSAAIEEMMGEAAGKDVTRFDFINGITGAGRREADADRRYDLERLGSRFLTGDLPMALVEHPKKNVR